VLQTLRMEVSARLENTVGFSHRLYRRGMAAAQRTSPHGRATATASIGDRIVSAVCGFLINIPAARRARDGQGAGGLYRRRRRRAPGLLMFFRALGINLKQPYGSTETGGFVTLHRDDEVEPETVGRSGEGARTEDRAQW
jgi:long-chain acyl-CoA synthetase